MTKSEVARIDDMQTQINTNTTTLAKVGAHQTHNKNTIDEIKDDVRAGNLNINNQLSGIRRIMISVGLVFTVFSLGIISALLLLNVKPAIIQSTPLTIQGK